MGKKISASDAVILSAAAVQAIERLKAYPKILRYIEGKAREIADAVEGAKQAKVDNAAAEFDGRAR